MTFLESLKNLHLTSTEDYVAKYIVDNLELIPYMNIADLASATNSSNSAIIRICKKLNYSGFRELKMQIIKEIENQKHTNLTVDFETPIKGQLSSTKLISIMGSLYKEGVDSINSNINCSDLEKAASIMLEARRIFIYCIGDTKSTARTFINQLHKLDIFPISATDNHEELRISRHIIKQDCVIFISYRGKSLDSSNIFPIVKKSGCKIITITANIDSSIYKIADIKILIPDMEKDAQIATFYSQLAFSYILNILYSLLYIKTKQ